MKNNRFQSVQIGKFFILTVLLPTLLIHGKGSRTAYRSKPTRWCKFCGITYPLAQTFKISTRKETSCVVVLHHGGDALRWLSIGSPVAIRKQHQSRVPYPEMEIYRCWCISEREFTKVGAYLHYGSKLYDIQAFLSCQKTLFHEYGRELMCKRMSAAECTVQADERVAQFLCLDSWLFWTIAI